MLFYPFPDISLTAKSSSRMVLALVYPNKPEGFGKRYRSSVGSPPIGQPKTRYSTMPRSYHSTVVQSNTLKFLRCQLYVSQVLRQGSMKTLPEVFVLPGLFTSILIPQILDQQHTSYLRRYGMHGKETKGKSFDQ